MMCLLTIKFNYSQDLPHKPENVSQFVPSSPLWRCYVGRLPIGILLDLIQSIRLAGREYVHYATFPNANCYLLLEDVDGRDLGDERLSNGMLCQMASLQRKMHPASRIQNTKYNFFYLYTTNK